ncbi:hypothetical protein GCM10022222_65590 [Amycolatopsis ultiminotia]|uniref:Uncharacterized protein n=1 Tax=Amycolatopsis ultiminotia TaxID=543629 RepID=A0ABP6XU60_9PSEU
MSTALSDAHATPVGDLRNDSIDHRLLPGDGELVRFLRTVYGKRPDLPLAVEAMSAPLHALPQPENTRRNGTAVRRVLAAAGGRDS